VVSFSACVVRLIILYMYCHDGVGYVLYCDCLKVFGSKSCNFSHTHKHNIVFVFVIKHN
jgi:hypothetical protein